MVSSPGASGTVTFQSLNGDALPACLDGITQPQVAFPSSVMATGVSMMGPAVFTTDGKNLYLPI